MPESFTAIVNVVMPTAVGVPDRTPALLKLSPAGSVPEFTVHESAPVPPDAASAAL